MIERSRASSSGQLQRRGNQVHQTVFDDSGVVTVNTLSKTVMTAGRSQMQVTA